MTWARHEEPNENPDGRWARWGREPAIGWPSEYVSTPTYTSVRIAPDDPGTDLQTKTDHSTNTRSRWRPSFRLGSQFALFFGLGVIAGLLLAAILASMVWSAALT